MRRDDVVRALKASKGDFTIAALGLGCSYAALRSFVVKDQQLAAVWISDDKVAPPDEGDLMVRTVPTITLPKEAALTPDVLGEAMMRQDREILRQGLQKAGIKDGTIQKLGLMENFAVNTGRFLGAALDMTHRVTVFQGVALFERAEYIKEKYLENEELPHELRIEWQKAYNEIAELIAKTSDRVLAGTEAAVNMMRHKNQDQSGGKKRKPGFVPLEKVKQVKPEPNSHGGT